MTEYIFTSCISSLFARSYVYKMKHVSHTGKNLYDQWLLYSTASAPFVKTSLSSVNISSPCTIHQGIWNNAWLAFTLCWMLTRDFYVRDYLAHSCHHKTQDPREISQGKDGEHKRCCKQKGTEARLRVGWLANKHGDHLGYFLKVEAYSFSSEENV